MGNRKSSALNRMIRDYVDDGAMSARISTHVLDEISDMLECLEDKDIKMIDSNRTMAMLNMCWAWFQKNEKDPVSNCDERKTTSAAIRDGILPEHYRAAIRN